MSRQYLLGPFLIFTYCVYYYFFGEQILHQYFYGDGNVYGRLTQHFLPYLTHGHVDSYHLSRIFPSLLLHYIAKFVYFSLSSVADVMRLYAIYNMVLLTLTAVLWGAIVKRKNFSSGLYWLGWISLFINYAVLREYQYLPILTDLSALFFGMLILYCYVYEYFALIVIISLVIGFTWLLALLLCWALLLTKQSIITVNKVAADKWLPLFSMMLFLLSCYWARHISLPLPIAKNCLLLSIFLATAYVGIVTKESAVLSYSLTAWRAGRLLNGYLLGYAVMLIMYYGIYYWLNQHYGHDYYYNGKVFLHTLIASSIQKPGIFYLAHIVFWGPLFLLLLYRYKSIAVTVASDSYGLYLFLLMTLALMLGSESRQLIFNYPFLIYAICLCLAKENISWRFVGLYAVISLVLSKVYLNSGINAASYYSSIYAFPWQHLYMNIGPWMSWTGYLINGVMVIAAASVFMLLLKRVWSVPVKQH